MIKGSEKVLRRIIVAKPVASRDGKRYAQAYTQFLGRKEKGPWVVFSAVATARQGYDELSVPDPILEERARGQLEAMLSEAFKKGRGRVPKVETDEEGRPAGVVEENEHEWVVEIDEVE